MLGIIPDWLTGWFLGAAKVVGQGVADVVHWAIHALAVVLIAIFERVYGAWRDLASFTWVSFVALGRAISATGWRIWQIIRVLLPRFVNWLWSWIQHVWRDLHYWVGWLWARVRDTIALLYREIGLVIKWAVTHIWDPLWKWAQFLYRLIREWAWVAFWWITHLESLAEAMVFHIAAAIERHAWELAALLGKFFTALIVRNLARFVKLMESILVAVF